MGMVVRLLTIQGEIVVMVVVLVMNKQVVVA